MNADNINGIVHKYLETKKCGKLHECLMYVCQRKKKNV